MLQALREFRVGRPQMIAGLMLLAFMAQCFWSAKNRKISDLEYQYMLSGLASSAEGKPILDSPFTSLMAGLPLRAINLARKIGPASWSAALAVPRPWLLRLPFLIFGVWLGGALWWVARRLFDDEGGYVALGLYCTSPALIKISSNIGPEIILAWSILGLIYTAIGVAHTLFAPPKKWVPRIVILGLSIGFALATAWWSFTLVMLAFAYMLYLAPGCRRKVLVVLAGASTLGCIVLLAISRLMGSAGMGFHALFAQKPGLDVIRNLLFPLSAKTDGYVLVLLFIAALTAYGSWPRTRYFGNTAPQTTAFACVLLFALVPAFRIWDATLGLTFVFIFIGGIFADLLETRLRIQVAVILAAAFLVRLVLTLHELKGWVQNLM
ncbi:MAG TPA: glycosyltransferase family 39 protein [Candidatus Sulfotelmatobacter sp.]|nr:glycosyltransferase family 39 protein [Candidatus Sulfotelmatobacter sp.]